MIRLRATIHVFLAAALLLICSFASPPGRGRISSQPRTVVLGIDGMDYRMTTQLIREGKLPNLAKLAADGSFIPIRPSMPPLSPVAWSNFITGMNPGGHGVFDFIRRDLSGGNVVAADAVSKTEEPSDAGWRIPFTRYVWPKPSQTQLLRDGRALWQILDAAGVRSAVYKMPANFPAAPTGGESLAGMGTPDIEGTYGTFSYFSDRIMDWERHTSGGRVFKTRVDDGVAHVLEGESIVRPYLHGPVNPFVARTDSLANRQAKAPFDIFVDSQDRSAVIRIDGRELLLKEGEWSDWVPVQFDLLPHVKSVSGQVRFLLQEAGQHFRLYASPVNLLPGTPGLATGNFDRYLNDALGPYFTKGMSEETKAITEGFFRRMNM